MNDIFQKYRRAKKDESKPVIIFRIAAISLALVAVVFTVINIVKELALKNPGLLWDLRKIIPGYF